MYQTYTYDKISNTSYSKELSAQKGKAKKGIDPISAVEYGTACLYGTIKGVKQDIPLALKYAQQTSEKGFPDGKILYGIMKLYGVGIPKDVNGAFNEFYQVIQRNNNNLDAQYLIAFTFFNEGLQEIQTNSAVQYMINAGTQDQHNVRQAQGDLGKLYLDGKFCQQNLSLSLRYLTQSAKTYGPAQEYLSKCFNSLNITNLEYNSKPKKIYQWYLKLVQEKRNLPESEEILIWAHNLGYPPAMFDYAQLNISRGNDSNYFRELIEKAAHRLYLPAIDAYIYTLMSKNNFTDAVKFAKYSIYFKSNVHQNAIAIAYRNMSRETLDPGIYFRYRKYNNNYDVFDDKLIESCKFAAMKDGNPEETYYYAICLENGFSGLNADPEGAFELYKRAANQGHQAAGRNYAHFLEFGEYCAQDFGLAIKKIENFFSDIEALTTLNFLRNMNNGTFSVPFQYSSTFNKLQNNQVGPNGDIFLVNIKIARLLTKNEFMIPNYKYAEKYANKGKKKYPLGNAILGFIYSDPSSASKPNSKKAEKLFMEASLNSSEKEVSELYARFLINEGRDSEASALGVKIAERPVSARPVTPAQLTNGEDLYNKAYIQNKSVRVLERAAIANYPPAQTEYAAHIIANEMKKEYKTALDLLESASIGEYGDPIQTAYVYLGYMYYKGLATKTDYQKAVQLYIKAIDSLEYAGFYGLSLCYAKGNGLIKDPYMAYRYWQIANNTTTAYKRPFAIHTEIFCPNECLEIFNSQINHLTVSDLDLNGNNKNKFTYGFYNEVKKKDYTTAYNYYTTVIESTKTNDKQCHIYKRSLAFLQMKSLGCKKCFKNAMETFQDLGEKCSSSSISSLDDIRNANYCKWKYENKAPFWMTKEVEVLFNTTCEIFSKMLDDAFFPGTQNINKETSNCLIQYADFCFQGKSCDQDYGTALDMYELYTNLVNDNPNIYIRIAYHYENSLGTKYDKEKIGQNYYEAASLGETTALFKTAQMLLIGDGLPMDRITARAFIIKAADKGHQGAKDNLIKFREAVATRKDVIDPVEEWLYPQDAIEFKRLKLKNVRIQITPSPSLCLKPIDQIFNENNGNNFGIREDQIFLEKGIRYMKGLGVKRSYNDAMTFLAKSILSGNVIARIYFAVLCRICKVHKYAQIYSYNMYKAKLNGCSLAFIEEAKLELGKYNKNVTPDLQIKVDDQSREKAARLLQFAIDSGDIYARYIRGRYMQDMATLEKTAEEGFGKSLYYLGKKLLDTGRTNEAYSYLERSASTKHPKALFYFGMIHLIRGNIQVAEPLLIRVKDSGNSSLCVRYGKERLPSEGRLQEDQKEAFAMFQYAHKNGNIDGTLQLAECYRLGIGTPKDLEVAASLYEIGCQRELPEFFENALLCYTEMTGMKSWMAQKKYESKTKKVILGKYKKPPIEDYSFMDISSTSVYYPSHSFFLAMNNKLIDINKYKQYIQIATNLGLFSAIKETVIHLLSGLYLKSDVHLALTLLHQLMDIGWGTAFKLMGDLHFANCGVTFSHQKALHMYKKSALLGSKSGKYKLGYALIQGIGCRKDVEKGWRMIDNSGCKYAYHYLNTYTRYTPKVCRPVLNCLSSNCHLVENVGCINDVKLSALHDLRFGLIVYHQYFWQHDRKLITPMSMIGLKFVALSRSAEASFQYGFAHYVMGTSHYMRAIKFLILPADENNYTACHYLGRIFNTDGFFDHNLAIKYLEKSAINLKNVEDMWILGTELHKSYNAVKWMSMAAEIENKYRWDLAVTLMKGSKNREIEVDKVKAAYFFKKCEGLSYERKLTLGVLFNLGEDLPKELGTSRYYFKECADSSNRPNEKGTKFYIAMCLNGEGGGKYEPWSYIKQVADSNDFERGNYCAFYGKHLDEIDDNEGAIRYFERSGFPECLERARYLREYLEAKRREEERRRQQQQQQNNNDTSLLKGAAILGFGIMLLTGIPVV